MIVAEAEDVVAKALAPLPLTDFLGAVGDHRSFDLVGMNNKDRAGLLGADPTETLLDAFATHATTLDCHSPGPLGPAPGLQPVSDAAAFRELIGAYHERNYTVRLPDVGTLSPALAKLTRALEILLQCRVECSAFWSRQAARAKIHFDHNDNLSVQLAGRKRWLISNGAAGLYNPWRSHSVPEPQLPDHRVVDVGPGDLIYIPRGLPHSVESTTDSIHVSILFTPLTRREEIIALLDHLSDTDRALRETAPGRLAANHSSDKTAARLAETLDRLRSAIERPDFIAEALDKRSSREISDLPRLVPPLSAAVVGATTRVRHAPLAAMHHFDAGGVLDLAIPGGHIMLHAAAAESLAFIAATPSFAATEIPGLPIEHCIALTQRLIAAGLLVPDV